MKAPTIRRADEAIQIKPSNRPRLGDLGLILALAVILVILAGLGDGLAFLAPLRLCLAFAFVLFAPGYCLAAVLYPGKDDLDGIERAGLSIGLSIAIIPLLALLLDQLPWGLRLWPILLGEGAVTLLLATAAALSRWRIGYAAAYVPGPVPHPMVWRRALATSDRWVYLVICGGFVVAAVSAAWVLAPRSTGEDLTEFYLLGPQGLAEGYPRMGNVGESLQVTAGVTNQEGKQAMYRIEVRQGPAIIGGTGEFSLADDATIEAPLAFTPSMPDPDARIEFWLYRDGGGEPYRKLQLWVEVQE